jgi:hypothetical protein
MLRKGSQMKRSTYETGTDATVTEAACSRRLLHDLAVAGFAQAERQPIRERLAKELGTDLARKLVRSLAETRPLGAPPHQDASSPRAA